MNNENFENSNPAGLVNEDGQPAANLPTTTVDTPPPGVHEVPATPVATTSEDAPAVVQAQLKQVKRPLSSVSNANFMAAIFHTIQPGASAVVCSKSGDPSVGAWLPKPAAEVHGCAANTNNYFNCASFKPDVDGTLKARKDNAVGFHCLVLDDVGTKIVLELLAGIKPSWVTETSPGNFQVGFILANPLTLEADVLQLQNAVIAAGLSDPGAKGMARWMRLPAGVNGKDKYKTPEGKKYQCQLRQLRSDLRYTVEELVAMLKLNLDAESPASESQMATQTTDHIEPDDVAVAPKVIDPAVLANIPLLLEKIDPDCPYPDWMRVLMAVFHETAGSAEGLAMVDDWSSKGTKYRGTKDVEVQWRSFRLDVKKPVTMGTLIYMARAAGADTRSIMQSSAHTSADASGEQPSDRAVTQRASGTVNPLTRFSLKDSLPDLEKQRVEQRLILGQVVLMGQANAFYAPPGTGKTLIFQYLIIESIKQDLIDPDKLYYINMDDNSNGLVEKVRLSVEYGFHMLADGHRYFEAKNFRIAMETMVQNNTASGVVVVIDTLKKFVNAMDKTESAQFTRLVRQFSLKGGTVIALSHTNKNPGPDGKLKYTGTTDIVDDFDCVYILHVIAEQPDTHLKVVEFNNIKRRGDVAETAAYSYSTERGLTYNELLTSVQEVDPDQLEPLKQAAELENAAPVIAAVEACIAAGVTTKMKMADAASKSAGVSNRIALQVIDKYTGEDASVHRWMYVSGARGSHVFSLLPQTPGPVTSHVDTPETLPPRLTSGYDYLDNDLY